MTRSKSSKNDGKSQIPQERRLQHPQIILKNALFMFLSAAHSRVCPPPFSPSSLQAVSAPPKPEKSPRFRGRSVLFSPFFLPSPSGNLHAGSRHSSTELVSAPVSQTVVSLSAKTSALHGRAGSLGCLSPGRTGRPELICLLSYAVQQSASARKQR